MTNRYLASIGGLLTLLGALSVGMTTFAVLPGCEDNGVEDVAEDIGEGIDDAADDVEDAFD